MMNPIELVRFIESQIESEQDQLMALAALADAPGEEFTPLMRLPVQNELPALKIGDGGLGSILAGQNYGIAAPVPGEKMDAPPSIGQLLVGENNGTNGL